MQKSDEKVVADRRTFLKLASGVVAGPAALASGKPAEATEAKPTHTLYRETDHVRRYYELARS
jgi:hypothetical protein